MRPVQTINGNGILSKAQPQQQTPVTPINISTNARGILGDSVYRTPFEIDANQQRADQAARDAANKPKKGKIICIRWHELGYMDDETARLDQLYGQWLLKHDKAWMRGYLTYAPYIVKQMRTDTWQGRLFLKAIGPLVNPWANEMAFRMGGNNKHSVFGSLLMELSTFVFRALDKVRLLKLKGAA
ncbi:MAG: hypothetical protein WC009_13935 [Methylotenera sp.]